MPVSNASSSQVSVSHDTPTSTMPAASPTIANPVSLLPGSLPQLSPNPTAKEQAKLKDAWDLVGNARTQLQAGDTSGKNMDLAAALHDLQALGGQGFSQKDIKSLSDSLTTLSHATTLTPTADAALRQFASTYSQTGASTGSNYVAPQMGSIAQRYAERGSTADTSHLSDPSFNPSIPKTQSTWRYAPHSVDLYPEGDPSPQDIMQHGESDCGVVAALASLAQQHPAYIKSLISKNPSESGVYNVKMYDPNGKPITMQVNSQFLSGKNGQLVAVTGRNGQANWATVMEKAAAKYNRIYHTAVNVGQGNGGIGGEMGTDVLPMFTGGGPSKYYPTGTLSPSSASDFIKNSLVKGDMLQSGFNTVTSFGGTKTVTGHAYSIMGVVNHDGQQAVEMRNPWGVNPTTASTGYSGKTDGVLYVPMDQFVKHCDVLEISAGAAGNHGTNGWTPPPPTESSSMENSNSTHSASTHSDGNGGTPNRGVVIAPNSTPNPYLTTPA